MCYRQRLGRAVQNAWLFVDMDLGKMRSKARRWYGGDGRLNAMEGDGKDAMAKGQSGRSRRYRGNAPWRYHSGRNVER